MAVSVRSRNCSKSEPRDYTGLKTWWSDTWNTNFVKSISLLVKDNLKNPLLALLQPGASLSAKEHETVEIASKGQCSRGDECGLKRDTETKRESKRNSLERGTATAKSPSGKENEPTCFVFF